MKSAMNFLMIMSLALLLCSTAGYAQSDETREMVSVSGEGNVRVEPDLATVRFGVVTRNDDPLKAQQLNEESAKNAMNSVRDLGVEERKIRLSVLQLNEIHEYDQERRRQIPAGYQATREVIVELNDLNLLPALIARVTQSGANRLHGLNYDVSNRDEIRNQALQRAVRNARNKAVVLTETLDVKLGRVISISEERYDFPRPMQARGMMTMEFDASAAMGTPDAFAAGEIEVNAHVQVIFGIE
jgi:uncharacterized protein